MSEPIILSEDLISSRKIGVDFMPAIFGLKKIEWTVQCQALRKHAHAIFSDFSRL